MGNLTFLSVKGGSQDERVFHLIISLKVLKNKASQEFVNAYIIFKNSFKEYHVLPRIMCTYVFGPNFQGKMFF